MLYLDDEDTNMRIDHGCEKAEDTFVRLVLYMIPCPRKSKFYEIIDAKIPGH